MIKYVETQLSIWGKWSAHRSSAGLGYPSVCPMFRDVGRGGRAGSQEPAGVSIGDLSEIHDMDKAVNLLPLDQRRVCIAVYVTGGKADDVAHRLGMARRTLYDRLHIIHSAVLDKLNGICAGA